MMFKSILTYKITLMKIVTFLLLLVYGTQFVAAQNIEHFGGGEYVLSAMDEMSELQRQEIKQMINTNIQLLISEGKINPNYNKTASLELQFPLAWNDGFTGYNFYGISNYVDHNPAFPGVLTDYNCGTRTYDTDAGYNHAGIDYFLWPFSWDLMAEGAVKIVAAAPGMIVSKTDGGFDQNCAFNNSVWNAVYVRHDDGSIAWYGHMKNGSLTDKGLGDMVEAGEFLGLVGSSGNSTGPHLHFEVYDADDNLIDPYAGVCNEFNVESWWADQPEYSVPVINRMQTHNLVPDFNTCPELEDINAKNEFIPGDNAIFAFYAKDVSATDLCHLKIERADGSVWYEWDFYQPGDYVASYWYWTYSIPTDVPEGMWTWSCELAGNYYEHEFLVGDLPANVEENHLIKNLNTYISGDILTTSITANKSFKGKITITNINGQLIYSEADNISSGVNEFKIPFQNFASGIYLLNLMDMDSGENTSVKFGSY